MKTIDGHVSVINRIDLAEVENSIEHIKLQTNNIHEVCLKLFGECRDLAEKGKRSYNNLLDKMVTIYNLLGTRKNRIRRGLIDIVGTGLKTLFGTMDSSDAEYYDKIIAITKENQESLRKGLVEEINIMEKVNDQNKILNNNYYRIENKTNENIIKLNKVISNMKDIERREYALEYLQEVHNSIIDKSLELEIELGKIIDAILFLQLKIIHPFIITPEKLIEALINSKYENKMLFTPSLIAYQFIVKQIDVKCYEKDHMIHVIISIPILKEETMEIYEIITLPIVVNQQFTIFENKNNILAITQNRANFALKHNINDCFNHDTIYVCENLVLESTIKNEVCETNVFLKRGNNKCEIKIIQNNVEFFHKINNNKYLYAITEDTPFKCNCKSKQEENGVLSNIGILYLDNQCKFSTLETDIITSEDIYEEINNDVIHYTIDKNCCQNIKLNEISPIDKVIKIKGTDLRELRDLSIEIKNQRNIVSKLLQKLPEKSQGALIGITGMLTTIGLIYFTITCIKGRHTFTLFNKCFNRKRTKPVQNQIVYIPDQSKKIVNVRKEISDDKLLP